jgi:hypothetical protein
MQMPDIPAPMIATSTRPLRDIQPPPNRPSTIAVEIRYTTLQVAHLARHPRIVEVAHPMLLIAPLGLGPLRGVPRRRKRRP